MHKYIVEFLGTLLLVFVVVATGHWAAIGAALAAAVFLGGKISGGAFNPAVALAFHMKNKLSLTQLVMYILVQLVAAVSAVTLYKNVYVKYF